MEKCSIKKGKVLGHQCIRLPQSLIKDHTAELTCTALKGHA